MSPFTRENYIDAIKNALAYLKAQVELNNAINKYSINIEAETFYAGFLNVVYGFSLKNGNHTERNIPSIDLYEECQRDDGQRVAVQVTSNNDAKKVKKTLESFCSYDYQKDYTRLIILMITEKKNYRSTFAFPADIGIQFDQSRDIVDVYDLIQNIEQTTETDHLRSIYEYLAKELPSWIIRIRDTEDKRPRETELYDRLFSIFENDRKNHPSIRMMDPDPSLFPKGLPEIFSDGRLAVEEEEEPRAIRDMILDSWKREDRRHILLVGEGGIGKTVAMLTLPIEDWFKEFGIPVIYVHLQRLDTYEGNLNRYIKEKIGSDNYERCIELANRAFEGHPELLLLLDGFNEVPDKFKKKAEQYIREWMERPGIQIITTSRMGFFLENRFSKYRLQPLLYDTVRSFLLSAGLVEEQLPRQHDKIWDVINIPLMLVMYTQIERVMETANSSPAAIVIEWKEPKNAAHIVWDYMQMELYRCIEKCIGKDDSTYSIMQYATAILVIAPYVCCRMSRLNKFYIKRSEFHELIRNALGIYDTHSNLLVSQILNIREEFDPFHQEVLFIEENTAGYARILIDNMGLFQTQKNRKTRHEKYAITDYSCSLMHQNFRDALAAFFICSCLPKSCSAKEKRALLDQADYYVKDYMAEHLSDGELLSVWERHREEDPEDGQITFILMDLIGRQRNYDYRELDFSGINLSKINLHSLLSRSLDICPLPMDSNKLNSTKISVDCFSPNGHTSPVESVAFSPDGRRLASGANDGTMRVWDIESGESRVLKGHAGSKVISLAFSPDGRQLASGSGYDDGALHIWDFESGKSRVLEDHAGWVNSVTFSPDGKQLASVIYGMSLVWDIESGESRVLEGNVCSITSVAFSPDGRYLAGGRDDGTVRVWDLESGANDGKVRVWDLESDEDFVDDIEEVISVAFSPDGKQLASCTNFKMVRIWDLESGESHDFGGSAGALMQAAFSPDVRYLASGGDDGLVRVWDLTSGESHVIEGQSDWILGIAFSADGRQLASGADDGTVRVWDLANEESRVLEGHTGGVSSVAFSADGGHLAIGASDNTVRVWNFVNGDSHVIEDYGCTVNSVAFSHDGGHLAIGASDSMVRIWDIESGESRVLEGHAKWVNSVAFSPDGRQLASGSGDDTVRVWDLESGESHVLECYMFVNSIAFSPDGRHLAIGASDSTVQIWDIESGARRVIGCHADGVNSVAFSPDGKQLASGANDCTVLIWDLESGARHVIGCHADGVNSVAFSPDGKQLASGANDRTVCVWNLDGGERCVLGCHADGVNSVAFSPDGRYLVSGAEDCIVRVWDVEEHQEVKKYSIISHINLNGANFELAIIDEKDKEILRAAGAKV